MQMHVYTNKLIKRNKLFHIEQIPDLQICNHSSHVKADENVIKLIK